VRLAYTPSAWRLLPTYKNCAITFAVKTEPPLCPLWEICMKDISP
jgi:hypothetical protein